MARDVRVVINQAAVNQLKRELLTSCVPGAELLERELKQTILDSKPSGRVYTEIYRMVGGRPVPVGKRAKAHQASAPGQAPAIDSGELYDSITSEKVPSGYGGRVGARVRIKADYWAWLEFGTRFMAPRPFVRPTLAEVAKSGIILRAVGKEARKRIARYK